MKRQTVLMAIMNWQQHNQFTSSNKTKQRNDAYGNSIVTVTQLWPYSMLLQCNDDVGKIKIVLKDNNQMLARIAPKQSGVTITVMHCD